MRAFITGSRGFLGRHFTAELRRRGWHVHGADLTGGQDCLDHFRLVTTIYDLVVHCAAQDPHRSAIDTQAGHLAANTVLDAAMFGWAVRTGQRHVLYLSSSAAYPVDFQGGDPRILSEDLIDLDGPLPPDANYGWAKLSGEKMAADARDAGIPVTVVRPFSGYGADQGERWPFGAFLARARRREDPFTIWGDGSQVRDWIHVDDLVAAALAVVDAGVDEPVNLCTGFGTSMRDLAELVCTEVGYDPHLQLRTDAPAGVRWRVGDPRRMNDLYTAKTTLAEGVRRALT